jgi:hypothetical protein
LDARHHWSNGERGHFHGDNVAAGRPTHWRSDAYCGKNRPHDDYGRQRRDGNEVSQRNRHPGQKACEPEFRRAARLAGSSETATQGRPNLPTVSQISKRGATPGCRVRHITGCLAANFQNDDVARCFRLRAEQGKRRSSESAISPFLRDPPKDGLRQAGPKIPPSPYRRISTSELQRTATRSPFDCPSSSFG